ncbi:MAG: tyrosine-type recombinase/integrase [Pyrinomonadaceae bacterium]|nr:tyrosine-type recombinase/integrase [Pyrinomonadaceae bacterium]
MAGQIIKKSENSYLVRIFQGRDANGKRRYFSKQIRGTKKEAQKYLNAVLRDQDIGVFVEPAAIPLNEYLDKWLSSAARPRLCERTYNDYEQILNRYVRPMIGSRKLRDVRPLEVQKLYSDMQERGLSPRSVRYTHAVLSSAFKQAVRWQMLVSNPCKAVELPRMVRREMEALSPEAANLFLVAAAKDTHYVVFAFALATGMRPEEYLAVKWSDVDLVKGTATVQRTLQWRKSGWYFGAPKTLRSRRTIPLPTTIVRALVGHKRQQAEARLKAGAKYQQHDFVFANDVGAPLNSQSLLRRRFKSILKRAELSNSFRLYDLRHTCATLLLLAGENPKVVSERLGHASIVLTLDIYSHVLPSMQQAATEKLERILFARI